MTTYQGQAAQARDSRKLLQLMLIAAAILVIGMTVGAVAAIARGSMHTPAEIGLLSCTEFLSDLEESELFQ